LLIFLQIDLELAVKLDPQLLGPVDHLLPHSLFPKPGCVQLGRHRAQPVANNLAQVGDHDFVISSRHKLVHCEAALELAVLNPLDFLCLGNGQRRTVTDRDRNPGQCGDPGGAAILSDQSGALNVGQVLHRGLAIDLVIFAAVSDFQERELGIKVEVGLAKVCDRHLQDGGELGQVERFAILQGGGDCFKSLELVGC
jgi:hypothetical protein